MCFWGQGASWLVKHKEGQLRRIWVIAHSPLTNTARTPTAKSCLGNTSPLNLPPNLTSIGRCRALSKFLWLSHLFVAYAWRCIYVLHMREGARTGPKDTALEKKSGPSFEQHTKNKGWSGSEKLPPIIPICDDFLRFRRESRPASWVDFFKIVFLELYVLFLEFRGKSTQLAGRLFFKIPEIPNSNFQKCWFSRPS